MKRMVSTNDRADKILSKYKEYGLSISAQVSDAIICAELPQYNPLHLEGLYLLDTISNGLKDWRGPYNSKITPASAEEASYEAVKRGLAWAKNNRSKDPAVIGEVLSHFEITWNPERYGMDDIPKDLMEDLKAVQLRLGKEKHGLDIGLGQFGRDILDEWENVWNDPEVYEAIITIFHFGELSFPFEPFEALAILRGFEQTYLSAQITK